MTHDEIKSFIALHTGEGSSLSQIQDMLSEQGVKLTFMELRLIASEIETSFWKKVDPAPAAKPETPAAPDAAPDAADDLPPEAEPYNEAQDAPAGPADAAKEPALRGRTSITVDQLQRPGFLATGSVTFGSGADGKWCLDQMGRVMFEKLNGKPDQQDVQEFQMELQRAFAN